MIATNDKEARGMLNCIPRHIDPENKRWKKVTRAFWPDAHNHLP